MARKIILHCHLSPGDILMLTAAVRDLVRSNPGEFMIAVRTPRTDLWENNPYLTPLDDKDPEVHHVEAHYPLINSSNQLPYHFIHGYRKYLAEKLNVKINQGPFHGDIHLTQKERYLPNPLEEQTGNSSPYWVVINGGKSDFTVKHWQPIWMQWVVDQLQDKIHFVQTGLNEHMHNNLTGKNVTNLMDCKGRDFIRLIYHAEGVICGITYAMHLAAAVPFKPNENRIKPCVVIAGGREAHHWEAYNGHRFLDTIGSLPCCASGGCWKARVIKLNDGDNNDNHLCERPVETDGKIIIPKCMSMITKEMVLNAIQSYLEY